MGAAKLGNGAKRCMLLPAKDEDPLSPEEIMVYPVLRSNKPRALATPVALSICSSGRRQAVMVPERLLRCGKVV